MIIDIEVGSRDDWGGRCLSEVLVVGAARIRHPTAGKSLPLDELIELGSLASWNEPGELKKEDVTLPL